MFCRVLETVQIDVSGQTGDGDVGGGLLGVDHEEEDYGDSIQEHHAGSCLIVMYKTIRDLVLEGKVELLM